MTTRAGARWRLVTLENPTRTPDGEGGFSETWTPLTPATMWAEIVPATARKLAFEVAVANTVISQGTHIVTMRFHAGITTQTRLRVDGRTLAVLGVQSDAKEIETLLFCAERVL